MGHENDILERMEHVPALVSLSPTVLMLFGLVVAIYIYIVDKKAPERLAATFPALYRFLLNKWYFDELYDFLFVRPAFAIGRRSGRAATARSSTASGRTAYRPASST